MNVAIIPARGGSVRIPRKNIRDFHGQPIIAYSIRTALASGLFGNVIVSTDDEEIAEVAQKYGADVMMRGQAWCGDAVGPLDVVRHSLTLIGDVAYASCVYATAPMLTVGDLLRGYRAVQREGIAYSFSVGTVPNLHDSAQFFWGRAWAFKERVPEFSDNTVMIPIAPERDCDVNTPEDWERCEQMYAVLQMPEPLRSVMMGKAA